MPFILYQKTRPSESEPNLAKESKFFHFFPEVEMQMVFFVACKILHSPITLKGLSHEKVGEIRPCKVSLGSN
jgi:hypothetical protein